MLLPTFHNPHMFRHYHRYPGTQRFLTGFALALALAGCDHARPHSTATSPERSVLPHTEQAYRLLQEGSTFAAVEQMEAARAEGTADVPLLLRLAQTYDSLGDPEAAAEVLGSRARSETATSTVRLGWSRLLLKLGWMRDSADAVRPLLTHLTSLAPQDQQFAVRSLVLAGQPERAEALIPAAELQRSAEWQALKGLARLTSGHYADAADLLNKASATSPSDAWNLTLLGRARMLSGDARGALDSWSRAAKLPDAPPAAAIGAANVLLDRKDVKAADVILARVQGEDRKLPAYWEASSRAAQMGGEQAGALAARAFAAYNAGDPWSAEAMWRRALAVAGRAESREILAALYNSAARRQDPQTALAVTGKALSIFPADPYFLKSRAEILLEQNQLLPARAAAERYQRTAPPSEQASAWELLSRVALDSGDTGLLHSSADHGRQLSPRDPLPLLHLAEWQYSQPHTPESLRKTLDLYREAEAIAPDNAEAYARAGIVLSDLGDREGAARDLLKALSVLPGVLDGTPSALLAQIYQRLGKQAESRFESARYAALRANKARWPSLLKSMRGDGTGVPGGTWLDLARLALDRHENWIALCASSRAIAAHGSVREGLLLHAAAAKRSGWFDDALEDMVKYQAGNRGASR